MTEQAEQDVIHLSDAEQRRLHTLTQARARAEQAQSNFAQFLFDQHDVDPSGYNIVYDGDTDTYILRRAEMETTNGDTEDSVDP